MTPLCPIALAALSRVVLVFAWWSRPLFFDRWVHLTGRSHEEMRRDQTGGAAFAVIGSIVIAVVLFGLVARLSARGAPQGIAIALTVGVGFVVPPMLSSVVYEGKPLALFAINAGFQLVALALMGAILGAFVR